MRLNRRLAPDLYLGVGAIVPAAHGLRIAGEGEPGAVDYAVEMRRYRDDATLAHRLRSGAAGAAEVQAVGRRLAAFHRDAAVPVSPERSVPALEAMLAENFATLRSLAADRDDVTRIDDGQRVAAAMLAGRREELTERARSGRVRDGHGDLRAEHVVLERGIEIVDCVEFDPALREIDVSLDLAFLAMDLMRHSAQLARTLVAAYREAGGDPGDDALVTFFAAQRALIRAKVALVRATQVGGDDASRRRADARALIDLAGQLGWRLRLGPLTIVCGVAASGKSTLAAALAQRSGAVVVASDLVRKALAGVAPNAPAPAGSYAADVNRATYAELGRRAAEALAAGGPVIVDATFRFAADRRTFAAEAPAPAVWIECRAPASVRATRARARRADQEHVSDADAAVAVRQGEEWEPLGVDALVVDTDQPRDAVLADVRDALDDRLRDAQGKLLSPNR